ESPQHHLHAAVREGGLSLGECLRRGLTIELDNFMVRALTSLRNIHLPFGAVTRDMLAEAKGHLDGIALLGLTEQFDRSLDHFCDRLGWPRVSARKLNQTEARIR